MKRKLALPPAVAAVLLLALLAGCPNNPNNSSASNTPSGANLLTIAASDWPGWLVWEIALQKNFFTEAGVNVKLDWHDYTSSREAFRSGEADAVCLVCND